MSSTLRVTRRSRLRILTTLTLLTTGPCSISLVSKRRRTKSHQKGFSHFRTMKKRRGRSRSRERNWMRSSILTNVFYSQDKLKYIETSVFPPNNLNSNANYFNIDNSYVDDHRQGPAAFEEQKDRQQKIREMLKEFSKKKDQVIKDQIKQRVQP